MKRKTPTVLVGKVKMGSEHPVVLQAMTSTDTSDVGETVEEILQLNRAGAEVVRIAIPDEKSAQAVPRILSLVRQESDVPIVGDFHFNGNVLLRKYPEMAKALDKYRINPGNASDHNFAEMLAIAKKLKKPVRIGANAGSVKPDLIEKHKGNLEKATLEMMEESMNSAKKLKFPMDQIVLSAKLSDVPSTISIYEKLTKKYNNVLHIGLTEAGLGSMAEVSSSITIGTLLHEGIGETIRVSITPQMGDRVREVQIGAEILQALDLKNYKPRVISCPGCGRTKREFFQKMVAEINRRLDEVWPEWKEKYPETANLKIAVMGCVVNGPGEAREADFGIAIPGKAEDYALVFERGKAMETLFGEDIIDRFWEMVVERVEAS